MAREQCDIVIIGAGIAGLSAAKAAFEDNGLTIVLLEEKSPGSNNPSPLTFSDVIESHGLQDCVKARYSSFAFHNYSGSIVRFIFNKYPLVVLDYRKACSKMFLQIQQKFGDHLRFVNIKAVTVSQRGKEVVAGLEDGSEVEARILIDCSGKNRLVASQLPDNRTAYYSHVYGAVLRSREAFDNGTAFFLWPCKDFGTGGGWFYPLSDGRVSFGYASISTSAIADRAKLKENFQNALQRFKPYADYLGNAEVESVERGTIPVTYARQLTHGQIVIAGDAAGMATSWTCMGIEPSLNYGSLAGRLAATALLKNDSDILKKFQVIWEEQNKIAFDAFAANAEMFWTDDRYFWEWIIMNDLAYLTPEKVLGRMRSNDFVPAKATLLFRALRFKFLSLLNKGFLEPKTLIVKN